MAMSCGKERLIEYVGQIVRCAKYNAPVSVSVETCKACEFHRGILMINEAVNGRPDVSDILCGVPVHRRVEYIVREVANGSTK